MKFLGNVLATIVGIFVFSMLLFFGIVFLGVIFGGDEQSVEIKENSVIELNLNDVQFDYAGKFSDPWVTAFSNKKQIIT